MGGGVRALGGDRSSGKEGGKGSQVSAYHLLLVAVGLIGSQSNHGSFYPNQVAAFKVLIGDMNGARMVLQSYFDNQFQEQIVGSGEQPLEAVRTRPFHYRCFNLEAIIVCANFRHGKPRN